MNIIYSIEQSNLLIIEIEIIILDRSMIFVENEDISRSSEFLFSLSWRHHWHREISRISMECFSNIASDMTSFEYSYLIMKFPIDMISLIEITARENTSENAYKNEKRGSTDFECEFFFIMSI